MSDRVLTSTTPLWLRFRVDPVWLVLAVLLAGLGLAAPEQAGASVRFLGQHLLEVAPFLLLSVALAAYAQASGADAQIARAFRGHKAGMIGLAAVFGAVAPFCSCGVIPLIAALLAMGVPLAPVMAFWLSSPVMDPSMFVLTVGVLGMNFAVAKTTAAIGLGLIGGFGMLALQRLGAFAQPLRPGVGDGGCAGRSARAPQPVVWRVWQSAERLARLRRTAVRTLLFLGKWLALAYVLESLMLAHVPADWIAAMAGATGWQATALATLIGVPAYINGYAALPLVAGLMEQGLAAGPALAFVVAGGVTCIPAAMAVFALVRLPVFATYLGFALVGSLMAGLIYGALAP